MPGSPDTGKDLELTWIERHGPREARLRGGEPLFGNALERNPKKRWISHLRNAACVGLRIQLYEGSNTRWQVLRRAGGWNSSE